MRFDQLSKVWAKKAEFINTYPSMYKTLVCGLEYILWTNTEKSEYWIIVR